MLCGEASIVKTSGRELIGQPLKCRSWLCDQCCDLRRQQLEALAFTGQPTRFLTLTSRHVQHLTATQAANNLRDAWRILYHEIVRKHGKDRVSCLSVFEETKTGWPHLHILCRMPWVSQAWLSQRMKALTGALIVDIRRLRGVRMVARYVAKYIAKNPVRYEGCKRYWRSQDWDLSPPEDEAPVAREGEDCGTDRRGLIELLREVRVAMYSAEIVRGRLVAGWPWPTAPPFLREPLNVRA